MATDDGSADVIAHYSAIASSGESAARPAEAASGTGSDIGDGRQGCVAPAFLMAMDLVLTAGE
ncbi:MULTISPECIES: hypothetical protein [Arthrobacter]|uniref:hypothetical protein n=1 Tax=Arthrobacter TaxID=1663 RepID=UPI0035C0ED61